MYSEMLLGHQSPTPLEELSQQVHWQFEHNYGSKVSSRISEQKDQYDGNTRNKATHMYTVHVQSNYHQWETQCEDIQS